MASRSAPTASSAELAERLLSREDLDLVDTGGVGGTLAGNALSLAAARATLEQVLTADAFETMIALGTRYDEGVQRIDRRARPAVVDEPARRPLRVPLRQSRPPQRHRVPGQRRRRPGGLPPPLPGQPGHPAHPVPQHGPDVPGHHRSRRGPAPPGPRRGRGLAVTDDLDLIVVGAGSPRCPGADLTRPEQPSGRRGRRCDRTGAAR